MVYLSRPGLKRGEVWSDDLSRNLLVLLTVTRGGQGQTGDASAFPESELLPSTHPLCFPQSYHRFPQNLLAHSLEAACTHTVILINDKLSLTMYQAHIIYHLILIRTHEISSPITPKFKMKSPKP